MDAVTSNLSCSVTTLIVPGAKLTLKEIKLGAGRDQSRENTIIEAFRADRNHCLKVGCRSWRWGEQFSGEFTLDWHHAPPSISVIPCTSSASVRRLPGRGGYQVHQERQTVPPNERASEPIKRCSDRRGSRDGLYVIIADSADRLHLRTLTAPFIPLD